MSQPMSQPTQLRGWVTTFAGTGINLALGVLYSWSIIATTLTAPVDKGGWGWTTLQSQIPYAVACGVFALMMVPAGRSQDKFGPRIVAGLGGALTGLGLILASFASKDSALLMIIGFGILAGTGIGFGYGSATPPAVKWFPPQKKGLISGLVVAGFGLASVYISPLATALLKAYGVNKTFLILGIAFFIVTVGLAQLLANPPAGYVPKGMPPAPKTGAPMKKHDYDWQEMISTPTFYLLWLMFAFGAAAGLLTIGTLAKIVVAKVEPAQAASMASLMVALLAVSNAGGRIVAGFLSDKIGRTRTMLLVFVLQAFFMAMFPSFGTVFLLILGSCAVGFNYGSLLSLFPSTTADYYGTKNLGVNYGLVFTAWGVGGVFGPIMAGRIKDVFGAFNNAFYIAAVLCIVAAGLTFLTKAPRATYVAGESPAPAAK